MANAKKCDADIMIIVRKYLLVLEVKRSWKLYMLNTTEENAINKIFKIPRKETSNPENVLTIINAIIILKTTNKIIIKGEKLICVMAYVKPNVPNVETSEA